MVQVDFDINYNKGIPDCDRIYRIEYNSPIDQTRYMHWLNRPTGEAIITSTPLIECGGTEASRRSDIDIFVGNEHNLRDVMVRNTQISMPLIELFGFKATQGDLNGLSNPKTIAFLNTKAKELGLSIGDRIYYGDVKPENSYTVVAFFDKMQLNSEMGKIETIVDVGQKDITLVGYSEYCYYIKLRPNVTPEQLQAPILDAFQNYLASRGLTQEEIELELQGRSIRLLPITDAYFSNDVDNSVSEQGNRTTCYSLFCIAILVIVIALINFINFFFALVPVRIKTVNAHKIFGSPSSQLRSSFIFEALGLVFFALLLAWVFVQIVGTSSIAGYIPSSLAITDNYKVLLITILSGFLVAILGSIYPSRYITSFPAAMVIKGSFASSKSGKRLRYTLIGFQFIISISLIVCTVFIGLQHRYMLNHEVGFNRDLLLTTQLPHDFVSTTENRTAFGNRLLEYPQIKDIAWSVRPIVAERQNVWEVDYKDGRISFQAIRVSWNFLRFMGIEVVDGRDFNISDEAKDNGPFIFNTRAQKEYDLNSNSKIEGIEIIGFCNNFNFKPLQYAITPMTIQLSGKNVKNMRHLYIRTTPNADIEKLSTDIKQTIKEFVPNANLSKIDVMYYDQEIGTQYDKERKLSIFVTLFSLLSVAISLMGVFGLVMFETQHRLKEIGVRRVHGASIAEILAMFNSKFVRIVLICFVIAVPISYYIIDKWLESFAYRTPIYWWVFVLALLVILVITVATVTFRSLRAATDDPAKSIKTE